ncbi:MAG: histidine kinase dimerization/phospho-acceptor domain-containing protein, partial [Anaerolineales bacterium]
MKIRTKLGLTYLTMSFLALAFINIFLYSYFKNALTKEALSHLESVSSIQKHRIEAIIEQNLERIRLVTSRTQLRLSLDAYIQTRRREDYEKILIIIKDALASIGDFKVISVLDLNGKVLVSTQDSRLNLDYSDFDFYQVAILKNNAEHFFLDDNNNLNLYLTGPMTINENFIGILLIESDASNIVTSLQDFSGLGQTGESMLGRKDRSGTSAQYLSPLRFDRDAALRRNVELGKLDNVMVKALTAEKQLLATAFDYRGQEVLAATNYLKELGWGLVVKLDKVEALEPVETLVKYIVIITLIVMFVIAWVSYALASIISKPISQLTHVARGINEGDLQHRADIKTQDEVGVLADSFNNMANTLIRTQYDIEKTNRELAEHRDHLEDMVSTRTYELERTIEELEAFSYSVSHDLRSPLRAIDGYAHILMVDFADQLSAEGHSCINKIRSSSQRMGELIDDLLDLSRINRKSLKRRNINLSEKVQAMINNLQVNSQRNVDAIVQPNLQIFADDSLMDVVVSNLIGNAWKYTGKNPDSRIEFGQTLQNGEAVYYVK